MEHIDTLTSLLTSAAELSEFMELSQESATARWWFTVNEEQLVMVEYNEDTRQLVFTAEVLLLDDIPEYSRYSALKHALAYNSLWSETGGSRMSLLPEDDSLHLTVSLAEDAREEADISQLVFDLLQRADDWSAAFISQSIDRPATDNNDLGPFVRV